MVSTIKAVYPSQYETMVILKDGSSIQFRPIKSEDGPEWLRFVCRLSPGARYLRFKEIQELGKDDANRYCTVDYKNTFAFVAEVTREGLKEIVGIGRYYRFPAKDSAEVAFAIEDAYQGRGIGTALMEKLVDVARINGINTFEAEVLTDNEQMMSVFHGYGFHVTSEIEAGIMHINVPIGQTKIVLKREEERERISTVNSIRAALHPKSIAVIGASRHPGTIGQLLVKCLLESGYTGTVYPVNPNSESVMSIKAYPSVLEIPGKVDLALIAVPGALVVKVADECGRKGVRDLVVISDGFKERGPDGAQKEKELRDLALGRGMRLIGPNCMGIINTDPEMNMNATFSPIYPAPGNVAFLSQSGAMGLVVLEYANGLNMGISSFLSIGNRADISSNDLLEYWEQDPRTEVILLYLESFGNPQKFSRIARRISARKPIVLVKGGTTQAGSRAAATHTGAMAVSEAVADALLHKAGIIRENTIESLFDVATLVSNQPLPRGKRLAIVTNGGGPGIIAADAAQRNGLSLPPLSEETIAELKPGIARDIRYNNPLDFTAGATAAEYESSLKVLAKDTGNDAVLAIFIPPVVVDPESMEDAISRVVPVFKRYQKPLMACFMGRRGFKAKQGSHGRSVPFYPFPENAVAALAKAAEYAEMKRKPKGVIPRFKDIKKQKARDLISEAMVRDTHRPLWLTSQEISGLLACYGLRMAETAFARDSSGAVNEAKKIGFPVALKLASKSITHKTEVGGVALNLNSETEVEKAFKKIKEKLLKAGREKEMDGVTVQRMIQDGIETIVGISQDPSFGPLIMFGLGGIYAELIKDVAIGLHPLTDLDAKELIGSVKMSKLFDGFRGSPPSDKESLIDLLLRLSAMVEDIPQIAELDFNPVMVMPEKQGYWIVDARVMVN